MNKYVTNGLVSDVGCNSDLLVVCDDINSLIEQLMVEGLIDLEDDNVSNTRSWHNLFKNGSVDTWSLRDARRLNHHVVMAVHSFIPSSML